MRDMFENIINYASNIQIRLFCILRHPHPREDKKKIDDDKTSEFDTKATNVGKKH